jgi:hypothetical protein
MTSFRKFVLAMLAAATVTGANLGIPSTATALPTSCVERMALANAYFTTGWAFYSIGAKDKAWYYWGRAGVLVEGCI